MKKIVIFLAMTVIVACNQKDIIYDITSEDTSVVDRITCTIPQIEYDVTSKSTISTSGVFSWDQGDLLSFWPDKNEIFGNTPKCVNFRAESEGKSVVFMGDGWGLIRGRKYYAAYPLNDNNTLSKVNVSYKYQTQTANNNLSHLGSYDYMYSAALVPDNDAASFTFTRMGLFLVFNITVPNEAISSQFKEFRMSSAEDIFVLESYYSPSDQSPALTPVTRGYSQSLNLSNISPDAGKVNVYMMSAPIEWKSKEITFSLIDVDDNVYSVKVTPTKNLVSGKGYTNNITVTASGETDTEYIIEEFDLAEAKSVKILNSTTNVLEMRVDDVIVPVSTNYEFADAGKHIVKLKLSTSAISREMFVGAEMKTLSLPLSVTSIGKYAFTDCLNLVSVYLPQSITSFGKFAFDRCTALTTFSGPYSAEEGKYIIVDNEIKYHAIGATWPTDYRFGYQYKYIPVPDYVVKDYLSYDAEFYSFREDADTVKIPVNSQLKFLFIPGKNSILKLPTSAEEQDEGSDIMYQCNNLLEVQINCEYVPYDCKISGSAGRSTIYWCDNVIAVSFGSDVKGIARVCVQCPKLSNVQLSEGLLHIYDASFSVLPSLKSITIPNTVQSIGDFCFLNCGLENVYFGTGLTSIGESSFTHMFTSDESQIKTIHFASSTPPTGSVITGLPATCKIYVPVGAVDTYKNDPLWGTYSDQIYAEE